MASKQETEFDVKAAYESYSTGKQTINDVADEYALTSDFVVQQFESYVQSNKGKTTK